MSSNRINIFFALSMASLLICVSVLFIMHKQGSGRVIPPKSATGAPAVLLDTVLGLRDKRIDALEKEIERQDAALLSLQADYKRLENALAVNRSKQKDINASNEKNKTRIDTLPKHDLRREFSNFNLAETTQ